VLDFTDSVSFEKVSAEAARMLAERIPMTADKIESQFVEGTRLGATPVTQGVALPHFYAKSIGQPELVLVRSEKKIQIDIQDDALTDRVDDQDIHAVFFLVSPDGNPGQHLRILAQIATRVDEEDFRGEWAAASGEKELKEVLLRTEYFHTIDLEAGNKASHFIGRALQDTGLPQGILIALIRRDGINIVPQGDTVLLEGDHLTLIGNPEDLQKLRAEYD